MRNTMRTNILTLVLFFAGTVLPLCASAATLLGDFFIEKGVDVTVAATLDTYNKYVWRGFLLDDDIVLQPGVSISAAGFTGGFWGSWDMQSGDSLNSDETDGYVGYSHDLGFINEDMKKISVSFGHTWYGFPETDLYSKEFYFGVSASVFLSPSFTWYADYADEDQGGADGNYYILKVSHSIPIVGKYGVTLDLGGEAGVNDHF
ncbi:MAG: TorF family putative porin, partial [Candidatus Omnitrophota bacterium]